MVSACMFNVVHTYLNLIVTNALRDLHDFIIKICDVKRYVKSFPTQLLRFKTCVEEEKISSKSLICLDVLTRWNSTYLMLETIGNFQKTFERLEEQDTQYALEFVGDDRKNIPLWLKEDKVESKTKLNQYLSESNERINDGFDILHWWKVNYFKFNILAQIVRDVLAIDISAIAFESTFSISG
ncbi:hypothetical protein VitviT2T_007282 [Vitis vinifera]|uniref:HAT C-terminal dimerisation domain-containing protein n=1 Tax=Vitis vinifera TaxID=29760 RepID=A0ABY9BZJ0_VITVI|nr:hypothetical protein VitviT2T_007282 [Vitis vinifera]